VAGGRTFETEPPRVDICLEAAQAGHVLNARKISLVSDAMSFVASIERRLITEWLSGGKRARVGLDVRDTSYLPRGYYRGESGAIRVREQQAEVERGSGASVASTATGEARGMRRRKLEEFTSAQNSYS
jgi:hypothetical protein